MRIGFIVTNLAGGGAEKAVLNTAAGLAARGHRVEVILLEHVAAHAVPAAIGLHALTREGREASKGWLGKRLAARRLARLLERLEGEERFSLLVSTLPYADEVALLARAPAHWCRIANTLSAEVARLAARDPSTAARRIARYRKMYSGGRLIAVSQGVAEDLSRGAGVVPSRIEVIPNPFDFSAIRQMASAPAELPQRPYLLHAGRFSAQKRHDLLLDAFARLRAPRRLVLLADADPALERMIRERGLEGRVQVAGFQQNPYPWIASAELLVLCSDHEGLPNVIIEALALGVPVVSTDCPSGPREILGAALPDCLVPTGDGVALAAAIERALEHRPCTSRVDLQRFAKAPVLAAYERLAAERA
ncbi:MAG: glycosyltransferase [Betaproteobacteria bacterium]|nr:glycosyltransferase [Betaproteobacteria bacterium]